MTADEPQHREVHFWSEGLTEPPCGTLEDRFEWSDAIEDVTCAGCREALAGDSGELTRAAQEDLPDDRPGP